MVVQPPTTEQQIELIAAQRAGNQYADEVLATNVFLCLRSLLKGHNSGQVHADCMSNYHLYRDRWKPNGGMLPVQYIVSCMMEYSKSRWKQYGKQVFERKYDDSEQNVQQITMEEVMEHIPSAPVQLRKISKLRCEGKSVEEIAEITGYTKRTVQAYISQFYRYVRKKLGIEHSMRGK